MKRTLAILLLCLLFTACRIPSDNTDPIESPLPTAPAEQYIRTGGTDGTYPRTVRIDSTNALADYLSSVDLTALRTATSDYDKAFFTDFTLLLILLEEPSGSIRHAVTAIDENANGDLAVTVDRTMPGDGTDDMAYWHILVPLPRGFGEGKISLILNDHTVVSEDSVRCIPVGSIDTSSAQAFVIASADELAGWCAAHGFKNSPAFRDALAEYDDEFFRASNLAVILLPPDSSMRRWRVDSVEWYWSDEEEHGGYDIRIAGLYPANGEVTADLLPQTLLFPLPSGALADAHLRLTITHGTY